MNKIILTLLILFTPMIVYAQDTRFFDWYVLDKTLYTDIKSSSLTNCNVSMELLSCNYIPDATDFAEYNKPDSVSMVFYKGKDDKYILGDMRVYYQFQLPLTEDYDTDGAKMCKLLAKSDSLAQELKELMMANKPGCKQRRVVVDMNFQEEMYIDIDICKSADYTVYVLAMYPYWDLERIYLHEDVEDYDIFNFVEFRATSHTMHNVPGGTDSEDTDLIYYILNLDADELAKLSKKKSEDRLKMILEAAKYGVIVKNKEPILFEPPVITAAEDEDEE